MPVPGCAVVPAPGGKGVAKSEAARAAATALSAQELFAASADLDDAPGGEVLANGGDGVASATAEATGAWLDPRAVAAIQGARPPSAEIGDGKPADGGADHELLSEEFQRHLWGGFDSAGPDDD